MECNNEHFRKGKNVAQAAKKLRDVYGEKALKDRQCRNWLINSILGIFHSKMSNDQVSEMKLMMTKSKQ